MIILRNKLFFNYENFAKKHGQEAADRLRKERSEIAKNLLAERNENNNGFFGGLKENLECTRKYHPNGDDRITSMTSNGIKTVRKEGESAEKFYYRHRNDRHEAAIKRAQEQAKAAESRVLIPESIKQNPTEVKNSMEKMSSWKAPSKKERIRGIFYKDGKLTTAGKAGLGIAGGAALTGAGIYAYKKYKNRRRNRE